MDENRIAGTARNMGGKVEEGFPGRMTGDTKSQVEGNSQNQGGQEPHRGLIWASP